MPAAFPSLGPEFDHFLYAVVCRETNGMQLTMASAIARSGIDPWQEAARISRMPRETALRALARFIPDRTARDPAGPAEPMPVEVLFALLPLRGAIAAPVAKSATRVEVVAFIIAATLLFFLALSTFMQNSGVGPDNHSEPAPPASSDTSR